MDKTETEYCIQVANAGEAFVRSLSDVDRSGIEVAGEQSSSVGSGRPTKELTNYLLSIGNPRDRLISNPHYHTNLVTSVARFIWMMAASDRLADIAFYENKVRNFSDDGIAVPGSNYGMRMLAPRPGLNQLRGIIAELKSKPSSRRGMITIYHAEDSTRQNSKDIPCTFGFSFLIREGELRATTIMRSNNAVALLPFNLFEFSLLAEVVAAELGVPLGPLSHFAISMHIYESDFDRARKIAAAAEDMKSVPMATMPANPLASIQKLAAAEADLRHAALTDSNIEDWIARPKTDGLDAYWHPFFHVLLFHAATRSDTALAKTVRSAISPQWVAFLPELVPTRGIQPELNEGLFGTGEVGKPAEVVNILDTPRMKSLRALLSQREKQTGQPASAETVFGLQDHFRRLAARSGQQISQTEFDAAIESLSEKAE